ncbi:hypothetical protein RRG08_025661 [Elysia crispata]|uniref:Uncharacterized protein n=1 Tax=Elysia crispata TaxID=231223 RepID=A0AAE1CXA7_9GAST|nr:hypothetical protein RRG08_025661 [Elysia crispata]
MDTPGSSVYLAQVLAEGEEMRKFSSSFLNIFIPVLLSTILCKDYFTYEALSYSTKQESFPPSDECLKTRSRKAKKRMSGVSFTVLYSCTSEKLLIRVGESEESPKQNPDELSSRKMWVEPANLILVFTRASD